MSGLSVAKSLGHHGHWGFSASFDVLEGLNSQSDEQARGMEPINVLLMQPGDIRHILYTISRRRRHRKNKLDSLRPVHFYLFETPVEILARDLLLLELVNDYELPIRQRANIFLEVFGNNKVQRRTSSYIEQLGTQLRMLVTKGIGQLDNVLDFSLLRYRERDLLEEALVKYSRTFAFDMTSLFEHRLRGLYEDRYDSRKALCDWDYHSTLKAKASIVHIKQYKEWRASGLAFEFGDQQYAEPNRTLLSYTEGTMKQGKERGMKKEVKGFWGDVVNSPYLAFGIDCDTPNAHATGLFDILNKNTGTEQHRHHAVEVALYNIFSVMWETETGLQYRMTKAHDVYSGLGAEASILSSKLDALDGAAGKEVTTDDTTDSAKAEGDVDAATSDKEKESLLPIIEVDEGDDDDDEDHNKSSDNKDETVADVAVEQVDIDLSGDADPQSNTTGDGNSGSNVVLAVTSTFAAAEKEVEDPVRQRERELAKAVTRAETVEETYRGVKIFPLTGVAASVLDRPRYKNFFHCVFVSSRAAQMLDQPYCGELLRPDGGAYAAVESGKFVVPLSAELKGELVKRETEMAAKLGWTAIAPPVFRRRRDEMDREDDVLFFRREPPPQQQS